MFKFSFFWLFALLGHGAATAENSSNLAVSISGNSSPMVYTFAQFTATVNNSGNKNVNNVTLKIKLPLSGTSPQNYILGAVGQISPLCSIISKEIFCNLGTVNRRSSKQVNFEFKFPQSSRTLGLVGTAFINNVQAAISPAFEPVLAHPALEINQTVTMSNSHCTGSAQLSSYFECLLFPSSISSHSANFSSGGEITITNEPTFTGNWEQNSNKTTLSFSYFDSAEKVLDFSGFAVDLKCFEGMVTFYPTSSYVAAYRVCMP